LIVRRVPEANSDHVSVDTQGERFPPAGSFAANFARLVLAAIPLNLTPPPAPSPRASTPKPPPRS